MSERIYERKVRVIYNKRIKGEYFELALDTREITKRALPGQFVNVKATNSFEPLLRRPLSIHRVRREKLMILYEVVGQGSRLLSQKKPGEYLDIIGPLGNGFNHPPSTIHHPPSILMAGGMGVAPLVFLAEKLKHDKPIVLIGAKTKDLLLCEKEFKSLGCEVKIATDDGSKGFKGSATELLIRLLSTMNYELSTIYACGPRPMLKEIVNISREYRIPAQVSLEEHMACGIGACLGCVVNTKNGYRRVCKDGPVFDADEVVW